MTRDKLRAEVLTAAAQSLRIDSGTLARLLDVADAAADRRMNCPVCGGESWCDEPACEALGAALKALFEVSADREGPRGHLPDV